MKQKLPFVLIFNLFFLQLFSQTTTLKPSYQAYTELPREVVYLHLNKTTLVKGEDLGFTAYVTDKSSKQLSQATKNLYCVVTDKNDSVVKQQLLKVDNGIVSGVVKIDSLFTSGYYTVKAYTNYMRNFKERNHFSQQLRIIDPEKEKEISSVKASKQLDVQLLPEGGHLVEGIPNVMGVIVKDSLGFGAANLEGKLKDRQNTIITTFKLNHLGIGRFLITPKQDNSYYVEFNTEDSKRVSIKQIEDRGVNLQLADMGSKIALIIQTNTETYKTIKEQNYTLAIHNGHQLETLPISFSEQQKVTKIFNKTDLFSGVNIFTLINQENQPILERLYFNYEGIKIEQSETEQNTIQERDTTTVTIAYNNIDHTKFNSFSVSVLPAETKSYGAHHNIISQTHLQPYVKGYIEDAQYYFTNITKKKQYDLDNLLRTQGWSAYAWDDVFNNLPKQDYNFDTGISFKVIAAQKKNQKLWIHPINESAPEFLTFSKEDKGYIVPEKYPLQGDSIKISKLQRSGHLIAPKVSLKYYPNSVPNFKEVLKPLNPKVFRRKQQPTLRVKEFDKSLLSTTQMLDEVVVVSEKNEKRNTRIKGIAQGRVDFFNEDKNIYPTFASYIQARGFRYDIVTNSVVHHRTEKAPAFYINGNRVIANGPQLQDLYLLPLNRFDYVVTNRGKIDFPYFGKGIVTGVIQIYLRDRISIKDIRRRSSKFMPPLAFEPKKTFYSPKYQNYQDAFFKEYGVIHWLPENSLNEKGELKITFPSLEHREINLFIEGVAENGTFISETKVLTLIKNK